MSGSRPAIAISNDFSVWLGNTSDADLMVHAGELFGFGLGNFKAEVVSSHLRLSLLLGYLQSCSWVWNRLMNWSGIWQSKQTVSLSLGAAVGDASRELHGVVWRVVDDLHFVAYNKKLLLCASSSGCWR